ncbi:hypothetical protein P168DRAFT_99664 [Aspergillus campestris IBT 28561]|uniref:Zn(2)-C6 fungal-type domain-containing protein n=1 Tax=Aspergillus campestris (strain IBT 28561) TaxID=1392248 RepID=A0A2I1DCS7_ASPC2|nr:uncharacterized protein P168DRAFT_99664 [Aspergillus campestris IBT 28561]PKY07674.1 hypothetical protein P168DRAFT_99664 [Aspergillus campestris IBT 28561]
MFGTIRYNKDTKDYEHFNLSTQPPGQDARGYTLVACDRCRTRKLKCTGEEGGCGRCRAASTVCKYTMNTPNRAQRARSSERRSSISPETSMLNMGHTNHPAPRLRSNSPKQPSTNTASTGVYPQPSGGGSVPPARGSDLLPPTPLSSQRPDATGNTTVCDMDTSSLLTFDTPDQLALEDFMVPELDVYLAATNGMELSGLDVSSGVIPSQPSVTDAGSSIAGGRAISAGPVSAHIPMNRGLNRTADCNCLPNLVELLERLGLLEVDQIGVDVHLLCLRSAVCICNKTISCRTCTACFDNPILLATISQSLATIAEHVYRSCVHLRDPKFPSRTWEEKEIIWGNYQTGDVLESAIWLGRYRVESPILRNTMVCEAGAMHLAELQQMLELLRGRLGPSRVAVTQVSRAGESTSTFLIALHELSRSV